MPFGLSNASSTFKRLVNEVLRPFIGKFDICYFGDVLVYSHDEASYMEHLSQVFHVLRQQKLYAKLKKCEIFTPHIVFLGYVMSEEEFNLMSRRLRLPRASLLQPLS